MNDDFIAKDGRRAATEDMSNDPSPNPGLLALEISILKQRMNILEDVLCRNNPNALKTRLSLSQNLTNEPPRLVNG